MPTFTELSQQATANLKAQGKSDAEIGQLLGTATFDQISNWGRRNVAAVPGATMVQDNATGQFVPVGGGVADPLALPTVDVTTGFNEMYANELEGNLAASTLGAQRTEAERLAAIRSQINRDFEIGRGRIEELGTKTEGGRIAQGGQQGGAGSGLGASSILSGNIALIRREMAKEITALESQRQTALLNADLASADRLQKQIANFEKEQDRLWERQKDVYLLRLQTSQEKRLTDAEKFQQVKDTFGILKDIPEGESIEINGYTFTGIKKEKIDPFFTSASITSLMLSLPEGQTRQITDPNTGQIWTISGLEQVEPDTVVQESTSESGEVFYTTIDKATGNILKQVSAGKIGNVQYAPGNVPAEQDEIRQRLALTAGNDGYVDPVAYAQERSLSKVKPGEFDLRYGYLLSPDQRTNLNVYQNVTRDTGGVDDLIPD